MNLEVPAEFVEMTGEIFRRFGVDDTEENRYRFALIALNVGVSSLIMAGSLMNEVQEHFPQFDTNKFKEDNAKPAEPPSPVEQLTPDICPNCERRALYQNGRWVCNCRSYGSSPKPDAICRHCNSAVVGEHYYWRCNCNRYDSRPDSVLPEPVPQTDLQGWSTSFPGT